VRSYRHVHLPHAPRLTPFRRTAAGNELAHFAVSDGGLTLTIRSRILLRDGHQVDYMTIYRKRPLN
jgi:hypothetical protein